MKPQLPDYDAALAALLSAAAPLGTEPAGLTDAAGRVLAEPVSADRDQPPFNRSAMDGYAVRAQDVKPGASLNVVAEVPAGAAVVMPGDDLSGCAVRIATGAAVPEGFDAVVRIEDARAAGNRVGFAIDHVEVGKDIHPRGADARAGAAVLDRGMRLGPAQLGIAAAVGAVKLTVYRRPRAAVLTTGDEVVPPAVEAVAPQQVRNSNAAMLTAWLDAAGAEVVKHIHVADEPRAVEAAARAALSSADVVITAGGVSVGDRDYLPGVWSGLGLTTLLHGVSIQPGRPLLAAKGEGALVIGLPGNPVSVLACAHLFAWPVLRVMGGLGPALPWRRVWLTEEVKPNPRRQAFRAARCVGETGDQVRVLAWRGSGDLAHTAGAHGLVRLPQQANPVAPGTPLAMLPLIGSGAS